MIHFHQLFITLFRKAYCETTDHRQITVHRQPTNDPPTTDHQANVKCFTNRLTTDNRPPTHWQVLQQPANHRLIDKCSTDRQSTDSPTHNYLPNDSHTYYNTNNPLTHQSYFNRVTTEPIFSITNFNSSFGMGTICYCKIFYKMIPKKNVDKLKILLIVPSGIW